MEETKNIPLALQLLMQTDGTVTELIKLITGEEIKVNKVSSKIDNDLKILNRHIYLQGKVTKNNWLYAESKIYLNNLPELFVNDLLDGNMPIGTLWIKYQIETFKKVIKQYKEVTDTKYSGFENGTRLLTRVYKVYNQQKIIMEIMEVFPVEQYQKLGFNK